MQLTFVDPDKRKDRYGRTLARVFVDGTDVNLAMVKAGMDWSSDE